MLQVITVVVLVTSTRCPNVWLLLGQGDELEICYSLKDMLSPGKKKQLRRPFVQVPISANAFYCKICIKMLLKYLFGDNLWQYIISMSCVKCVCGKSTLKP